MVHLHLVVHVVGLVVQVFGSHWNGGYPPPWI